MTQYLMNVFRFSYETWRNNIVPCEELANDISISLSIPVLSEMKLTFTFFKWNVLTITITKVTNQFKKSIYFDRP